MQAEGTRLHTAKACVCAARRCCAPSACQTHLMVACLQIRFIFSMTWLVTLAGPAPASAWAHTPCWHGA